MRKVKDFYYKKAKKDKYPARSVYKLEEALQKHKFIRRGDSVLDLGCCPGSWSLYASEVVGPKGIVVGVDLQEVEASPRAGGSEIIWLRKNIMKPELILELRKIRPAFRVVIADLAPRTTGNRFADHQRSMVLVRQTLALASELLLPNGNYYCKAFQGEDYPDFVKEVGEQFQKVKTIKPKSSRVESREVFVLGMGFRKKKF
ncbi:MAG TPA: RlmE family RNA methyltransferase [Desulfocapsa sulfexigens]|nr:RlmE family RNA methyltransferase [Desulfocapsa sulfexigens]